MNPSYGRTVKEVRAAALGPVTPAATGSHRQQVLYLQDQISLAVYHHDPPAVIDGLLDELRAATARGRDAESV